MYELVKDNIKRTKELTQIMSKFSAQVSNAYIDLVNDLVEYGQDPKNVDFYNALGYTWVVETELDATYGAAKKLLKEFYNNHPKES